MLYTGDNILISYMEAVEKYKLDRIINDRFYRVADTPLTYRQTNTLDRDNLLPKADRRGKGWRKYSLKEMVYLFLVSELKQYGVQHVHLRDLWDTFFKEPERNKKGFITGGMNKNYGDIAIGCVFGCIEMLLVIGKNGEANFYDPAHFLLFGDDKPSYLVINVNSVVNKVLEQTGKGTFPIKWSLQSAYIGDTSRQPVNDKEKVLLDTLRDKNYTTIKVKKTNGEIGVIYAGKYSATNENITLEELNKIVDSKDYQDINIIKRDGKIVNLTIEETIKP